MQTSWPLSGDCTDRREASFWHDGDPWTVKTVIETMTATLMDREANKETNDEADDGCPLLYSGTSRSGVDSRTVRLSFEAVIDGRGLYMLTIVRATSRRWHTRERFEGECRRTFAIWCARLTIAAGPIAWTRASRSAYDARVATSIAAETAAARFVEDPAPVVALQREIVAAMRRGWGFFTAHKEGGSHLYFDGTVFVRQDYDDEPCLRETFPDDASIVEALRCFYDWETRRDVYPHRPLERDVWRAIQSRLVKRHA